jgi:hypothetical protein
MISAWSEDLRAGEYGAQLVEYSGVAGDTGGGVLGVKSPVHKAYESFGWHREVRVRRRRSW